MRLGLALVCGPTLTPRKQGRSSRNKGRFTAGDAGFISAFGLDFGAGQYFKQQAETEVAAAYAAAEKDPSEINLQRLQAAKNRLALSSTMANVGLGGGLTYGGKALMSGRTTAQPNLASADAERAAIEQFMRTANRNRGGMTPPLAPLELVPSVETPIPGRPGYFRLPSGHVRGPGGRFSTLPDE